MHVIQNLFGGVTNHIALETCSGDGTNNNHPAIELICYCTKCQFWVTDDDMKFVARIQTEIPDPKPLESIHEVEDVSGTIGKGSTDVGDVSWVVPTTGFNTACWVPGTPGHSWQAVACGGTRIAEKGMDLAARTLAMTALELFASPATLQQANRELTERRGDIKYKSLMQPGQKPPLNYRRKSQN